MGFFQEQIKIIVTVACQLTTKVTLDVSAYSTRTLQEFDVSVVYSFLVRCLVTLIIE